MGVTPEAVRALIESERPSHVKLGLTDIDGVMRGKYMSAEKFLSALDGGFGFCDVVLGWDSNDQLLDNVAVTGWHSGYPDAATRILPETMRRLPWENDIPFFLCQFADGPAQAVCPRSLLARVLDRAAAMGLAVRCGFEYEFFLFEETPHSVRDKGFRNLKPLTPGFFGYSVLRSSVLAELHQDLLATLERLEVPVEGLHTETGAGVLEAALAVDDALAAADKAALFKTFTKVIAQRRGLMATFMAKWSMDWPGQSGHIHLSVTDRDGRPLFHDEGAPDRISATMRHFIGGQQRLLPQLLAMTASTINAYTRLVPGFWAPTEASWGVDNRTCALRAIPGGPKSQRVEYRVAAADANPYLALAAAIASGLDGVANAIEPTPPVTGSAYAQHFPPGLALPRTLWDAAQALKASATARDWFGDAFVDHFAATREWEEREFRRRVTDWELQRYFEII